MILNENTLNKIQELYEITVAELNSHFKDNSGMKIQPSASPSIQRMQELQNKKARNNENQSTKFFIGGKK